MGAEIQARRLAGLKELNEEPDRWRFVGCDDGIPAFTNGRRYIHIRPRYQPGETVYLRETHYAFGKWWWADGDDSDDVRFTRDASKPIYYADTKPQDLALNKGHYFADEGWYRRSPMFMPASAARYFVRVKSIDAQRLHDIELHPEDYRAEGYVPLMLGKSAIDGQPFEASMDCAWYERVWDEINGKGSYARNFWVLRYCLEIVKLGFFSRTDGLMPSSSPMHS